MANEQQTTEISRQIRRYADQDAVFVEVHAGTLRLWAIEAERQATEIERLRAAIRANALRWAPHLTHAEIDEVIYGR